ncbi:hypothetical protein L3Q65_00860 (plasmid) [Amycolatopsis sp. FU40]|uniref:hypothetical protein n=1 Tax=Amycolatopsis sp. FU40 TaxID=2914159 RepID=UPI001F1D36A3|nr:hypothetical protein [Amycolatopsis sp. FU40]UKD50876.1 hypothetical protein L3Q65_00860 [Amycolatopsis sp. FU40]
MADTASTPITALHKHGVTWHQTQPLRQHGITTVEQFADLAAQHDKEPRTSDLSAVPRLAATRIDMLTRALHAWKTACGT